MIRSHHYGRSDAQRGHTMERISRDDILVLAEELSLAWMAGASNKCTLASGVTEWGRNVGLGAI